MSLFSPKVGPVDFKKVRDVDVPKLLTNAADEELDNLDGMYEMLIRVKEGDLTHI